jgi:CrcB protein
MIWWYVALGSAAGGVARFGLSALVQQRVGPTFPVGTLIVNVSGSLLLGFLWRYALGTDAISPEVRAMLTTGFCGGYTTFSTFTYETMVLFEDGQSVRAGVYVISSVLLSLAAVWLGASWARTVLGTRAHG